MTVGPYCNVNSKYNENGKKRHPAARWTIKIKKRDGMCQECGSSEDLQAHHILHKSEHPDLKYKEWNGITLCRKCHENRHKFVSKKDDLITAMVMILILILMA